MCTVHVILACDLGQLATFSKVRNTTGGVFVTPATLLKIALLCKCFFMFLNETDRPKSGNTPYICFQELFFLQGKPL